MPLRTIQIEHQPVKHLNEEQLTLMHRKDIHVLGSK